MEVVPHADADGFARAARPLLEADPVRHTIALTALDALCRGREEAALLLTVHDGNTLAGAVLRTAGWPLVLSGLPAALADVVAAHLCSTGQEVDAANGPVASVEAFAAAYTARTAATVHVAMRERLHRLSALTPPAGVAGAARRAEGRDVELLADWQLAFLHEAVAALRPPSDPRPAVHDAVTHSGLMLWEVDGRPVAYATARRPLAGMSRIGPVYTPPAHRRRGYAGAVTAAATRWALDHGARHVALFTDLANPTTNRLYPRLGFRPVHDALEVRFGPGPDSAPA
jgi:GNAT superfamily N-acetyltransferase